MYCRVCGVDDDRNIIRREIEENENIITINYYGKCSECGAFLGEKEIFRYQRYEYIDEKTVKKILGDS